MHFHMARERVLPMPKGLFSRSNSSKSSSHSTSGVKVEVPSRTSSPLEPQVHSDTLGSNNVITTTALLPYNQQSQTQQQCTSGPQSRKFGDDEVGSDGTLNMVPSSEGSGHGQGQQPPAHLPPILPPFTPPSSSDSSLSPRVSPDRGFPHLPSMNVLATPPEAGAPVPRTIAPASQGHRRQLSAESVMSCPPLSPPSGSFAGLSLKSRSGFCLCQPDRKIPRPRNAFILFRQHLQLSVVAQHPGLSNPEISKIIGNQWRKMSPEDKQQWKNLAEEEKIRHHQQYPDYRYQPRRYGKNTESGSHGVSFSITSGGITVCNRCGGTVMNANAITPAEMPTPAVSPQMNQPKLESIQDVGFEQKKASGLAQLPLRIGHLFPRNRSHMKRPKSLHINTGLKEYMREDQSAPPTINPLSPGQKRRRPSQDIGPDQPRVLRSPISSPTSRVPHSQQQRRLNRPHSYSLVLPPRPQVYTTNSTSGPRGVSQHQSPHLESAIQSPRLQPNFRERAEIQGIPFLNKIKLLSMIAPPAGAEPKNLDATEIPFSARKRGGALIAVEGEDPAAVHFMIRHLEQTLSKGENQVVKVFNGPEVSMDHSTQHEDLSLQYLNIVSAWRKISYQIVDFISGSQSTRDIPSPFLRCVPDFGNDTSRMPSIQEIMKQGQDVEMSEVPGVSTQGTNAGATTTADAALLSQQGQEQQQPFRIALVPRYQFTNAEKYACTAPINDSYTPSDHWQWMASLWRYCAGPDLTIYVRDCGLQELYENNSNENPVDVRLDMYRTLVVRRGRPEGAAATSAPPIEEKALRRVTFEVGEYFRR